VIAVWESVPVGPAEISVITQTPLNVGAAAGRTWAEVAQASADKAPEEVPGRQRLDADGSRAL
jgi:hypothetical protein